MSSSNLLKLLFPTAEIEKSQSQSLKGAVTVATLSLI